MDWTGGLDYWTRSKIGACLHKYMIYSVPSCVLSYRKYCTVKTDVLRWHKECAVVAQLCYILSKIGQNIPQMCYFVQNWTKYSTNVLPQHIFFNRVYIRKNRLKVKYGIIRIWCVVICIGAYGAVLLSKHRQNPVLFQILK